MPNDDSAPPTGTTTAQALRELGCHGDTELRVGGVTATELAERFGTPLYVFSADVLRERVALVRQALGPRIELLWSLKANPSVAVTQCLRTAGCGAEIASIGELEVALASGHEASALRFAGPAKTDAELDAALRRGLGVFHVESQDELASLATLAQRRGVVADVAVRVNLPSGLAGARMRMSGQSSRFGVDREQVPDVVRAIEADPSLRLRGLHVYGGTQCFAADAFVAQAEALCVAAAEWQAALAVRFDELDVGGGFGIAVFDQDPAFDLDAAGRGLQQVIEAHDRPGRRWFVELGRFLSAPAGVYLTRVVRVKHSGGERHVALDGGMHHAGAHAGLGSIVRRPPLMVCADRLADAPAPAAPEPTAQRLGGPLCTPLDSFGAADNLPPLATGDLVAVLHAGAYGLSYSPSGFLSHATPAEVLVDGARTRVVRERGDPRDALRDQPLD